MRDDWRLGPEVFAIARQTLRVVKMNFAFTILYNTIGLLLAAVGILPPILAAVAQSIPDLGILANSSRLLRQRSLDGPLPNESFAQLEPRLPALVLSTTRHELTRESDKQIQQTRGEGFR
jgi:hypothetical protein